MDSHSLLQQPRHFGEDSSNNGSGSGSGSTTREDRGRLRDILNPGTSASPAPPQPSSIMSTPSGRGGSQGPPPAPTPPTRPQHHPASFSLRSPTQSSDFHGQPPSLSYSASPSNSNSNAIGGSRSILNPPLQAPAGLVTSSSVSVGPPAPPGTSNLHPPDRSPLHAPQVYYSHDVHDRGRERDRDLREPRREKASTGSFYDPTTDSVTTSNGVAAKDRPISDAAASWHNNGGSSTPKVSPPIFSRTLPLISPTCRLTIASLSALSGLPPSAPSHEVPLTIKPLHRHNPKTLPMQKLSASFSLC